MLTEYEVGTSGLVAQSHDLVDCVNMAIDVRELSISGERTTVYNLTVDDVHTYLVGPDGVWVHNCKVTGVMKSRSTIIVPGSSIRKINEIIRVWGGKAKD